VKLVTFAVKPMLNPAAVTKLEADMLADIKLRDTVAVNREEVIIKAPLLFTMPEPAHSMDQVKIEAEVIAAHQDHPDPRDIQESPGFLGRMDSLARMEMQAKDKLVTMVADKVVSHARPDHPDHLDLWADPETQDHQEKMDNPDSQEIQANLVPQDHQAMLDQTVTTDNQEAPVSQAPQELDLPLLQDRKDRQGHQVQVASQDSLGREAMDQFQARQDQLDHLGLRASLGSQEMQEKEVQMVVTVRTVNIALAHHVAQMLQFQTKVDLLTTKEMEAFLVAIKPEVTVEWPVNVLLFNVLLFNALLAAVLSKPKLFVD